MTMHVGLVCAVMAGVVKDHNAGNIQRASDVSTKDDRVSRIFIASR